MKQKILALLGRLAHWVDGIGYRDESRPVVCRYCGLPEWLHVTNLHFQKGHPWDDKNAILLDQFNKQDWAEGWVYTRKAMNKHLNVTYDPLLDATIKAQKTGTLYS